MSMEMFVLHKGKLRGLHHITHQMANRATDITDVRRLSRAARTQFEILTNVANTSANVAMALSAAASELEMSQPNKELLGHFLQSAVEKTQQAFEIALKFHVRRLSRAEKRQIKILTAIANTEANLVMADLAACRAGLES